MRLAGLGVRAVGEQRVKLEAFVARSFAPKFGEMPELRADIGHPMNR